MKTYTLLYLLIIPFLMGTTLMAQTDQTKKFNNAIDNMGYWKAAAELGLTVPNPMRSIPEAVFTGSEIRAVSVLTADSPDIVLITGSTSQSENSVFLNPNDADNALNSNNSTNQPSGGITLYGADYLYSFDAGLTWDGSIQGAGGSNSGDPTTAIGLNGRYYIGFINNSSGQSIAYSDDQGTTWAPVTVANSPSGFGNMLDKNHMWIDNSPSSPYEGNLYNAWTPFGGNNDSKIEVSRSTDDGISWSAPLAVSQGANPGYLSQGVNIQTGPEGEVYVVFTIYDNWPSDEDGIGMARSFDGGQTWESFRIINNIRGVRSSGVGKNMRVNAFPVMACDISTGPNRGNIYVTWTNIGVPGINTGNDIDVYMIRSEDNGDTWSDPIRVNQDPPGQGKKHYFGWITSDPATGSLSMIFYDDRNVGGSQVEVFCANSFDAGESWEDFKVSDVAFTPSPIPGLASQYFGDYLGIAARNGKVYPVWTDNRTGTALTYTSPYVTSTMVAPTSLIAQLNEETGVVNLTWTHTTSPTFDHYNIYRGLQFLGTSSLPFFSDVLPDYGFYRYRVTAFYTFEGESAPAIADVQWGNAQAEVAPDTIEVFVLPEASTSLVMELANTGELPLDYQASFTIPGDGREGERDYCAGIGGCGEGISGVTYGDVSNFSGCTGYEDYSTLTYMVPKGESFTITVYNSTNIYPEDVCGIWIDWNQNSSLLDDEAITVSGSPGPGPYTATITVPDDAKNGDTRLRIRIKRGGTLSPCGSAPNGEVEDYSLNVLGWVTANAMSGTIPAGSNQDITFSFDASGLELGTYAVNYTIFSNDPDNSELVVPVTMHVADAAVVVTADKDSLCFGGSTTLHADVIGGSGSFTYAWTSDPPGFISSEPDPLVSPLMTTTYFVEVSDGGLVLLDEITITVISLPEIDLGDDISVCEGGQALLDAGAGYAFYIWNNGQTGQSITLTEAGTYWVEVTNDFGCTARDTIEFSINPLPVVSLGEDQVLCEGSSVMLSAGIGYASYLWNTGATSYYISASEPGEYWVEVADENGCSNRDTIYLTQVPQPSVSLGPDQAFCEGSSLTLNAGSGFVAYLWNTGATTATINAAASGSFWVVVTDANGCSNSDTIVLTMDPLPVAPENITGPASVDNFMSPSSDFTSSESAYALTYEWMLEPTEAGIISGAGVTAQVQWSTGFTGTAQVSVKGINECGAGSNSGALAVSVYSSQSISEKNAISGIKLFPNPNDGAFVLQLNSASDQEIKLQVTTSGGNKILDSQESISAGLYQKNFNLSTLPAGTYYLVISDEMGRMISRQPLVVLTND